MELKELKTQLLNNIFQPFYVFTGEEEGLMKVYINKISEIIGEKPTYIDTIGEVYKQLNIQSLLNQKYLYIIRDDKEYLKQEKIWKKMQAGEEQGENILILILTSIDKRSKFYKQHSKSIIEFNKLSPQIIYKQIKKEIDLNNDNLKNFAEECNYNYSKILLEINKIKSLSNHNNITHDKAYEILIKENLISIEPKNVIFELVDAVCKKQVQKSFKLWYELKQINDNPMGLISLLYTNFRSMLLVQSAQGRDIEKVTGLTNWQIKVAKDKGNAFTKPQLINALKVIRRGEKKVKTGEIESNIIIEKILINIL